MTRSNTSAVRSTSRTPQVRRCAVSGVHPITHSSRAGTGAISPTTTPTPGSQPTFPTRTPTPNERGFGLEAAFIRCPPNAASTLRSRNGLMAPLERSGGSHRFCTAGGWRVRRRGMPPLAGSARLSHKRMHECGNRQHSSHVSSVSDDLTRRSHTHLIWQVNLPLIHLTKP